MEGEYVMNLQRLADIVTVVKAAGAVVARILILVIVVVVAFAAAILLGVLDYSTLRLL